MSRAFPWVANTSEEACKILKCWQRLGKTRRPKNNSAEPPSKRVVARDRRHTKRSVFGGRIDCGSKRLHRATVALSADEFAEWLQAEVLAGSGKERR
jgi:hypothetical protein